MEGRDQRGKVSGEVLVYHMVGNECMVLRGSGGSLVEAM